MRAMLELPIRIAGALAFRLIDHLPSSRHRDMHNRLHRHLREELARKLFAKSNTVRNGQFAGLTIPREIVANPNFQLGQIVGSFEVVVHDLIAQNAKRHSRFIDIGCGLGYYTVGVAKKFGLQSCGYDTQSEQIALANLFANTNGVSEPCHAQGGGD